MTDQQRKHLELVREAALQYRRAGYFPIPVANRGKKALLENWPNLRLSEDEVLTQFNGKPRNIGILLGEPSGWIIDIDLDCQEAIVAADYFLPDTAVFGRKSKPRSHYIYIAEGSRTHKFTDPKVAAQKAMVLEVRSTGLQTVFPPGIHEAGEMIEWQSRERDFSEVDADDLAAAAARCAAAAMVGRYWPTGSRHDASIALCGWLMRSGWSDHDVEVFLRAVCAVANDEEVEDRLKAVATTRKRLDGGMDATGFPSVRTLLHPDIADRVSDFLKSAGAIEHVPPAEDAAYWFPVPLREKGKFDVRIQHARYIDHLARQGFAKLYPPGASSSVFIRSLNQVIEECSGEQIKDTESRRLDRLADRVGQLTREQIRGAVLRGSNVYFGRYLLEFLTPATPRFKRATSNTAFFFYRNVWVEVRADRVIARPYDELDRHIWRHQIIDRDFHHLPGFEPDEAEFGRFIANITRHDDSRYNALTSALGYLLHPFKDPANARAVVFVDETVSDSPAGRTGKSLTGKSLSYMVPVADIDGKNFKFDYQFAFQDITLGTQLANFNDVKARFPFELLFSVITGDMQVERKHRDRFTIPFAESPKFLLSTNYVIEGTGPSHRARIFEVEFSDHYSDHFTPFEEFGHRLFDDWNPEEWLKFDHFMLGCVRDYLTHGLRKYGHVNLLKRKLQQQTDVDFAEWLIPLAGAGEEIRQPPVVVGRKYVKSELLTQFNTFAEREEPISGKKLVAWIKKFTDLADLKVEQFQERDEHKTQVRYITLESR